MKLLNIDRDTLLKPLQMVSGIVERRHTIPILSNVFLKADGNTLEVIATDLEIQIATNTKLKQKYSGETLTISARKTLDILRALPDKTKITLEASENRVILKSGKSKFNLQTLPAKDFPLISARENATVDVVTLEQNVLKNMLQKVQFAMAQQDIRYYLNGLLLVLDGKIMRLVATDGHRLSHVATQLKKDTGAREVILPRKTVLELVKLLGDEGSTVELGITDTQITIKFGDVTLVSKLVDGKFPDYKRVIPTGLTNNLTLSREILQGALQRASILSNEKFRGVRLVLTKNLLKIICSNNEHEEAEEELEVSYKGDPLDIGFNVNYLLDCLSNVAVQDVNCVLGDSKSSMLMTIEEDSSFQYVVMPMRI
ncbi:MAG: DNA polymerase III subunit beta [Proteobacteria bacterium]|nr:DNA polymerase III subunit beta [Pseudomonadota bacterium]